MGRHLPFSLPAPVRPSSAPWGAESASMTVRIETRRLRLRPFEAADAAAVEDCVGRWEIARMTTRIAHPYPKGARSEEHTSELQSLMRISYAVFCLKKKQNK